MNQRKVSRRLIVLKGMISYQKVFFSNSLKFISILSFLVILSCDHTNNEKAIINDAPLGDAPYVPTRSSLKNTGKVRVKLEIKETEGELINGTKYTFWTFGGKVPGKFIRITKGDHVEFHLSNHPNNKLPHNIDLHAVTGPGGGAEASLTAPGHTSVFSFTALFPGLFVYHCATAPVGMHIANGMYGLIMVDDPDNPLPEVDREYYIMQSEFYTTGSYGTPGLQQFSLDKALNENPEYVVFNGSVGANTGDKALQAFVGETVRLFIGNAGPNLISSLHIIGEVFDKVYIEGGSVINKTIQTTAIPSGGAVIVELKFEVPGTYLIIDHSVFRAFNKGALVQIKVSGEENRDIYSYKQKDEVYMFEGSSLKIPDSSQTIKEESVPSKIKTFQEKYTSGKNIFIHNCSSCHQTNGQGVPNSFPPLAGSDFLMNRKDKGIGIVLNGLTGPIIVKGKKYNSQMPALGLDEDKIADVLTYVRNSWGNKGGDVTIDEVKQFKK